MNPYFRGCNASPRPTYLWNFLRRLTLPRDARRSVADDVAEEDSSISERRSRGTEYVTFQLAEVMVTRRLLAAVLDRITQLAIPPQTTRRIWGAKMPRNHEMATGGVRC